MKKLPALVMVIALLVMNVASAAHADCAEGMVCDGVQQTISADQQHDQNDDERQAACDCCATCGHHHSHIANTFGKAEPIAVSGQALHAKTGDNYFSQPSSPPFQPPKA